MDKSTTVLITVLPGAGGATILAATWIMPMTLAERVVPSIVGVAGIMTILVRMLVIQARGAKVRIADAPQKINIKNNQTINH